ncbi:site-specific integrase [Lactiplantibacillus pentosus]|uniref:site-specific integrase n=1 Tax=Lactiplantibacillus pentosus TaxID=1589 RepID=UPI001CDBFAB9|nr:site-specific integrase [Lactiplantibacillus pentosus]
MFDCGLRMGEDMALRWSRIDFKNRTVNIDVTRIYNSETHVNAVGMKDLMFDTPKTKKSIRKIPMTDRVYAALKDLLKKQRSERNIIELKYNPDIISDLVFIKPKGRLNGYPISQTGVEVAMARISERAGLPHLNVHGCRHTYGVRLRESGVSLEDIKDLMGHSDLGTTRIYAEITPKVKDQAVSKLNNFLQD